MKQTTSVRVETELWSEAKKRAIDKGVTISELIEILLRKELGAES